LIAPLIGGELAQSFGFAWLMRVVGMFNIIYGPILVYLYKRYDPKVPHIRHSSLCNKTYLNIFYVQILNEHHNDLLMQTSGRGSRYKQLYNSMDME